MAARKKPLSSEEAKRLGSLGGRKTVEKHGVEHMRCIGKAGFLALAKKYGLWSVTDPANPGRRKALHHLAAQGKIRLRRPAPVPETSEQARKAIAEFEQLFEELTRDMPPAPAPEEEEENPAVAFVLASIRSAPMPEYPL
jgi:hypothetical protein